MKIKLDNISHPVRLKIKLSQKIEVSLKISVILMSNQQQSKQSLLNWAKTIKIWNKNSWVAFLTDYLIPFYVSAYRLKIFYKECLKKYDGKRLSDISDPNTRNALRKCLFGGLQSAQDPSSTLAGLMYYLFGLTFKIDERRIEQNLRRRLQHQKILGDNVIISILPEGNFKCCINLKFLSVMIHDLCQKLEMNVDYVKDHLNLFIPKIEKDVNFILEPIDDETQQIVQDPCLILHQINNVNVDLYSLDILADTRSEIFRFLQTAMKLTWGTNPYMTFIHYLKNNNPSMVKKKLECSTGDLKSLVELLGLKCFVPSTLRDYDFQLVSNLSSVFFIYKKDVRFSSVPYSIESNPTIHQLIYLEDLINDCLLENLPWLSSMIQDHQNSRIQLCAKNITDSAYCQCISEILKKIDRWGDLFWPSHECSNSRMTKHVWRSIASSYDSEYYKELKFDPQLPEITKNIEDCKKLDMVQFYKFLYPLLLTKALRIEKRIDISRSGKTIWLDIILTIPNKDIKELIIKLLKDIC